MITIETRSGKKAYETVAERVKKFRATYPVDSGWQLQTDVEFPSDEMVLCRARILDPGGRLVATGTAEETRGSSYINKTSAVENAETSAIGRALFAAGFGGGEFCSADELMVAVRRQEQLMAAEVKARQVGKVGACGTDETPAGRESQSGDKADREDTLVSSEFFNLPEECGIEFVQQGNMIVARDKKKGAAFSNREVLKSFGFSFDGQRRVWYKKAQGEEAA